MVLQGGAVSYEQGTPVGMRVLNPRVLILQKYEAVPRRAHIRGSWTLYHSTLTLRVIKKDEDPNPETVNPNLWSRYQTRQGLKRRATASLVREPASSGPLFLAPVSAKSSKNMRFSRPKRVFFELSGDTGAK